MSGIIVHEYHIFTGVEGLQCLACLDVNIIDDVEASSSLYDRMVQTMYGGNQPPTCIKPETRKCPHGEEMICVNSHSVMDINGG